uniref:wall-associated receptor kinase 2-like n=1 Tax=Erigeron canadensis TaxID=72917 RepID=UPI001CB90884|nr:wall-associated receptor kinase 2-like [Erigeron canadensis]
MILPYILICLISLLLININPLAMAASNGATANFNGTLKPGCEKQCGNITVPFPFGIAKGNDRSCSLNDAFFLTCNTSSDGTSPKLYLRDGNIEIRNISDSELRVSSFVAYTCYHQNGSVSQEEDAWLRLNTDQYTLSDKNKLTVFGCDDYSLIKGITKKAKTDEFDFSSGCIGSCMKLSEVADDGQCLGKGCCQISIPNNLRYYEIELGTFQNHTDVWSFNHCGFAFLGEEGSFQFRGANDLDSVTDFWNRLMATVPVVVDWVISAPNKSCSPEVTECKGNSHCDDVDGGGYRCRCNEGYEGNPYLDLGCQDIDECADPRNKTCYGDCINTSGSYNCTCPSGYSGDAKTQNGCKRNTKDSIFSDTTILTIVLVLGMLALFCGIAGICFGIRRRKLTRLRERFFEQNGGTLLKRKMNSQVGSQEAMTLFSTEQLRKATANFSQEHIIGRGAYGVVYKGLLPDKRVVAIKKSRLVDRSQAEQFINEIMIVTQVIHRNVVKLLGCCLEEEVPVLVYEFISNNTLFHHIHHKAGGMSWLSWDNRLRVAAEAASALGYLHSETTMPIIHRDVKSSNILLDDNYTAKISDFGASRLVPLDHEQVTTLIQGTLGYLDPEYFHTSQLTEKSDVYSFGVVLAELITGKKPIGGDRSNEVKNLATFFIKTMKENRLFEIVEPRLLREGTLEKLQAVAELVKRCLSSQGCDRPAMKEVAMELESLRKFTTHPWVHQQTNDDDTRSLILEVEQSDLYEVPLVSYNTHEWESYSGSTSDMGFQENQPR